MGNKKWKQKTGIENTYLSDIWELQDVGEDVEARGLQQCTDSLGQRWAGQRQELFNLHLKPEDIENTGWTSVILGEKKKSVDGTEGN